MNKHEYQKYLKSDHWKSLRAKKRRRSSKTKGKSRCAICGTTEGIQTHHLLYRNIYDVSTSDLRLLCGSCHQTAHKLMAEGLKFKSDKPQGIFCTLKVAVKKARGFGNRNMFANKE